MLRLLAHKITGWRSWTELLPQSNVLQVKVRTMLRALPRSPAENNRKNGEEFDENNLPARPMFKFSVSQVSPMYVFLELTLPRAHREIVKRNLAMFSYISHECRFQKKAK